jgi:outer membrane lipoprotein SlyB
LIQIGTGNDPDQLRSLLDWLRQDDEVRGRLSFAPRCTPSGGQMGGVVDVLTVALGSGGAGAALAGALSTWLASRKVEIELTLTGPGGNRLVLKARHGRDVAEVVRELERLVNPPERPE